MIIVKYVSRCIPKSNNAFLGKQQRHGDQRLEI